jgi:hypothetical protein
MCALAARNTDESKLLITIEMLTLQSSLNAYEVS